MLTVTWASSRAWMTLDKNVDVPTIALGLKAIPKRQDRWTPRATVSRDGTDSKVLLLCRSWKLLLNIPQLGRARGGRAVQWYNAKC